MFTFGREHERKCALDYLRDANQAQLVLDVIDAVHDVLEGKQPADSVGPVFARALSDGGTGVWEQTGNWLKKLAAEHPTLESVWRDLSTSGDGKVRFRVACFINELPKPLADEIGARLKNDRNKITREMAQARIEEIGG